MSSQRRHEAPDLGDAIVRMLRGLLVRAAEGDTEAVEQLQRIAGLAPAALQLGVEDAHAGGYSWTELGGVLGTSRQAAQQLAAGAERSRLGAGHVLVAGHNRRTCTSCNTPKN